MNFVDAAMQLSLLYNTPLWLIGLIIVVLLLLAEELGYRVGLLRRSRLGDTDAELGGGAVVLSSMFAVLGLILAFTYSSAVNRYEARKQAVVHEANALGTAYLRANLVAEPEKTELKRALYDYAVTRAPMATATKEERLARVKATLEAQAPIWPITERIVTESRRGAVEVAVVSAVNDVLDMHATRMTALTDKVPQAIIWNLVLIAAASLAVTGYNAGVHGRMSRWRMTIFALVLAGMMVFVVDFDRPRDGLITVSPAAMLAVIRDMEAGLDIGDGYSPARAAMIESEAGTAD